MSPHPKTPRSPKQRRRSGTLNQAWLLVEKIADHILNLDESKRADFVVDLEATVPSVIVTKTCEVVARRVAAGAVAPDVLAVFGIRTLHAAYVVFHLAHQSSHQVRILNAVTQFAPSFDQDVQLGLLRDLEFWAIAAVGRPAKKALALAKAAVRLSLGLDEKCQKKPKGRSRPGLSTRSSSVF